MSCKPLEKLVFPNSENRTRLKCLMSWVVALVCSFGFLSSAQPCTLYAATGEGYVQGGGTLLTKVRDERMTSQEVEIVRPKEGFSYLGLFTGKKHRFNMGINEKGFTIVTSQAGSVPKAIREESSKKSGKSRFKGQEYLVQHCATVDEALKQIDKLIAGPANFLMADPHKIALVEVYPNGDYEIEVKEKGVLSHTNHYVKDKGLEFNQRQSKSSKTRYNRINQLLSETKKSFNLDSFIAFSEDRNAGPDNSIFRQGSSEDRPSTLSVMSVHITDSGKSEIYLKWRDDRRDKNSWQVKRGLFLVNDDL